MQGLCHGQRFTNGVKTNNGIKISMIKIRNKILRNKKLKMLFAKNSALFFPLSNSEIELGTKAELKVPSEKSLLNVFGILKATKNASAIGPEPKYIAIKRSLRYPRILLIRTKKLYVLVDLIRFINHITLIN